MCLEGQGRRHDLLRRGTRPVRELNATKCHVWSNRIERRFAIVFCAVGHVDVMAGLLMDGRWS
jgi:hypothetical protein